MVAPGRDSLFLITLHYALMVAPKRRDKFLMRVCRALRFDGGAKRRDKLLTRVCRALRFDGGAKRRDKLLMRVCRALRFDGGAKGVTTV
jgi:hypothetical protein